MLRVWLAWLIGITAIAAPTGVAICHIYETVETVSDPCLEPATQEIQALGRLQEFADSTLFLLLAIGGAARLARGSFRAAYAEPSPVYLLVQPPPPRI